MSIVATTSSVSGSMRCTVSASVFDTQIVPSNAINTWHPKSVEIVAVTWFREGSIRVTVDSR